jgi:hydroxyethylthiazole kinase-like uncharacterized protein yjeF
MKILSVEQIREADQFTIDNEPIASIDLMERAAAAFAHWFHERYHDLFEGNRVAIVCGMGNNGGDGLAVARLLHRLEGFGLSIHIVRHQEKGAPDFETNLGRLFEIRNLSVHFIREGEELPDFAPYDVVVDALLGSGLNRPVEGLMAQLIERLNATAREIVSIDIPSGMFADRPTTGPSVEADHTFSFELPKLGFFFPENAHRTGEWTVESIGLHADFLDLVETPYRYLDIEDLSELVRDRPKFSHKGDFGHALLVAGSLGKMGAAILATRACLRAGVGLVTAHVPGCGYDIMQISVPEAMVSLDEDRESLSRVEGFERYDVIGLGPGLSTRNRTRNALGYLLKHYNRPMVLDADALNILASSPEWWSFVPPGSILTPHPKEFERLFGPSTDSFARNALQRQKAVAHQVVIVLKGAYTAIACPDGSCYFNSTGNPGMATAGSGDVLTGILTALLAQGYTPKESAILGVYWHGLAGDHAAERKSEQSLVAGDIVRYLGAAWIELEMEFE